MIGYPVDFLNMSMENWIGFVLGLLFAMTLNAEAQAFLSTALGDVREGAKDRLHFNPLLHLSLFGTIAFFIAGFGWPRLLDIDSSKFKHPRRYTLISRMAGPVANLLFASILSSVALLADQVLAVDPKLFNVVLWVNLAVGFFHLLPIPPLAGSVIFWIFIPDRFQGFKQKLWQISSLLLFALLVGDRVSQAGIVQRLYDLTVNPMFQMLVKKIVL